jgi:hypothetical protein
MPRVCVFETSGRIKLASDLVVSAPDLIVVGQTAPSPGVMITNGGFTIQTHDVRIEHLAIRPGDDTSGTTPSARRAMTVSGTLAYNVKLSNLSMSWGVDSNMNTIGGVNNVTVKDSIIAESLWRSIHPSGPRGNGVLVSEKARNVIFHGNLIASNMDRNIRWKYDSRGEMINNVVYGWGGTSNWNTTNISDLDNFDVGTYLDVIGNVYRAGPNGVKNVYAVYSENTPTGTRLYYADNITPLSTNVASNYRALARVLSGPTAIPASETFESVLARAGARPWNRNADDLRVIAGVRAATLGLRDRVGTWPVVQVNARTVSVGSDPITEEQLNSSLPAFEK